MPLRSTTKCSAESFARTEELEVLLHNQRRLTVCNNWTPRLQCVHAQTSLDGFATCDGPFLCSMVRMWSSKHVFMCAEQISASVLCLWWILIVWYRFGFLLSFWTRERGRASGGSERLSMLLCCSGRKEDVSRFRAERAASLQVRMEIMPEQVGLVRL